MEWQSRKTIAQTFHDLGSLRRIALMPFVPAGFPDLQTTQQVLVGLQKVGANLIEVGFPFSDPIADGPTIQGAFGEALARNVKVKDILAAIGEVRPSLHVPLLAMVSFSIVYRHGVEGFIQQVSQAGFDGIILPDLPPPQADQTCTAIRAAGLETVLLMAPTTPPQRRKQIAELCSGFIYYLSVSGVTGARQALPPDVAQNVRQIKTITDRPVCVGFGISQAEHIRELSGVADGAIVGSAIVRRMQQHQQEGPAKITQGVCEFCAELLQGTTRTVRGGGA